MFLKWVSDWLAKHQKKLDLPSKQTKFEVGKFISSKYNEENNKVEYRLESLKVNKSNTNLQLEVSHGFGFYKTDIKPWRETFVRDIVLEFTVTSPNNTPKAL